MYCVIWMFALLYRPKLSNCRFILIGMLSFQIIAIAINNYTIQILYLLRIDYHDASRVIAEIKKRVSPEVIMKYFRRMEEEYDLPGDHLYDCFRKANELQRLCKSFDYLWTFIEYCLRN